jgi:arginine utilization protein RocB
MFSTLQSLRMEQQVEYLTEELIKMKSYNGSDGERLKAEFLLEIIQSFPYYQQNPENTWITHIEEDEYQRCNVFAFIKGQIESNRTIIFHSHLDTVGTEDFGSIQDIAHDPSALQAYFSTYTADKNVQRDALSNEWLFGRGSLDMQSGIAVHLVNLLYFTENLAELQGNILVMFNPDEESQHLGIRSALPELLTLKETYSFEYIAAINNDFISPFYDGDENKYIYTGVAGKLLPCFYIFGREAHVGDCLSTIDPTLIASALNTRISKNLHLMERIENEHLLPPTCLYLKDDKKSYDVQTPVSSKLYFNYFVYEKSPNQVLHLLKEITSEACSIIVENQQTTFKDFCKTNQIPEKNLDWNIEVVSLEEHVQYLESLNLSPKSVIEQTIMEHKFRDIDDRMLAFHIVEALHHLDPEKKPRVILFFAPPYLPSNYLKDDDPKEINIFNKVKGELNKLQGEHKFQIRKYFPYLSDGSFLSFKGTEMDMLSLKNNFPGMDQLFPLPLNTMKELNIPCINLGVYGKNGHQWTERVYKPYSFQVIPELIRNVTKSLLND